MKKIFISIFIASVVFIPVTFIFAATGGGFRSSGSFSRPSMPSTSVFRSSGSFTTPKPSVTPRPSIGNTPTRSAGSMDNQYTNQFNTQNKTGASLNPFSINFFLWYWLFSRPTSYMQNSTTIVATTTKQ